MFKNIAVVTNPSFPLPTLHATDVKKDLQTVDEIRSPNCVTLSGKREFFLVSTDNIWIEPVRTTGDFANKKVLDKFARGQSLKLALAGKPRS
jgi:hypothetical protein